MPGKSSPRPKLSPESELQETLSRLMRSWMRGSREIAKGLGLSLPQLFLLGALTQMGEIPATRWAEIIGASPSTATGLLDGLESGGLIRRTHDEKDRRQVLVSLTPAGRRVAVKMKAARQREWKRLVRGVPAGELRSAERTLSKILARFDQERGGPGDPDCPPAGKAA
ncbi:MAG: MarR family transcriptional regulator [Euryarchaeota archaeon]|nr:MarR family transcriptional regulator [Euryarchaeota archaeon]MDE1835145.1 MarR family transcriptional regulator [Euryarchaeota archaeon]MDE1881462.1 MarR family transcriptional regulator [Euryarchaeota archaeon]MDE2046206.1 MarR family transcriptional regulator [Thermoplasmata archaeon]